MTKEKKFSEMLHGDIREMNAMSALRAGMGYGSGLYNKRKMMVKWGVVADLNRRNPALAAEHSVVRLT